MADIIRWVLIPLLIIGIVLTFVILVLNLPPQVASSPKLCLTITPNYLLSCDMNGTQKYVQATNQTIDKALSKNNCSIISQHDAIDIIYCYQKVENGTQKYGLFIYPYSED